MSNNHRQRIYKAIEIIKMMDNEDRRNLAAFIQQFTTRKQIRELYKQIELHLEELTQDKKAINKLLGLEEKNASDLMNKLYNEVRFFIEEKLHYNRSMSMFQLQNIFHFFAQHQATDYVEEIVISYQIEKRAKEAVYPNQHLDWYLVLKNKELYERNTKNRPTKIMEIQYIHSLDAFYWGEKILANIEEMNRHKVYNKRYDDTNLKETIEYIEKNLKDQALLMIYVWIAKMMNGQSPFYIKQFKRITNLYESLPENEYSDESIRSISYLLLNIMNQYKKTMGEVFASNYLGFIGLMEQKNMLLLAGKFISEPLMKNIIHLALFDNKHQWAEGFYKRFEKNLSDETFKQFIQSCLLIEGMEKQKSFDLLTKIELRSDDIYILLDTKILLLQNILIEFATKATFEILHLQDTNKRLRYFIKKHEFNEGAILRVKKWTGIIDKIIKCTVRTDYLEIRMQLEQDREFVKSNWLIRIIDMRMGKIKSVKKAG